MSGQDAASATAPPRGHILRRYVVIFVGVVCGVLLASSLVSMYFGYQESRRGIVLFQQEKAQAAALRIEQFVRRSKASSGGPRTHPGTRRRRDSSNGASTS